MSDKITKFSVLHGGSEIEALLAMVEGFSSAMKCKLLLCYLKGKRGWDRMPEYNFQHLLSEELRKDHTDYVDMANFAMMAWNVEQPKQDAERTQCDATETALLEWLESLIERTALGSPQIGYEMLRREWVVDIAGKTFTGLTLKRALKAAKDSGIQ